MKSHEFVTEDGAGVNDYQQMMNFLSRNKTPGIPPEQQLPLAMFRELQKTQQHNQQLDAELAAAEKRIDVATQGGELAKQQLGKHQNQLDKERGDIEQQRDAMGKIDKQHSEREKASADQLQQLAAQLEQIKQMPGASDSATKALEKQIKELKKNGVDKSKYDEIAASVARMQSMQQVDDRTMKSLIDQVKDAQAKAAELSQTRASVGNEIDQTTAGLQDEIDQLKQQLAHFREVEQTVDDMDKTMRVIAPRVNQIARAQIQPYAQDTVQMAKSAFDNTNQMSLPGVEAPPAPTQRQAPPAPRQDMDAQKAMAMAKMVRKAPQSSLQQAQAPQLHEDAKLLKSIKWATGKWDTTK